MESRVQLSVAIEGIDGPEQVRSGIAASYSVAVCDPEGGQITYEWDFRDGTIVSGVGITSVTHTFNEAGLAVVGLTVMDEEDFMDRQAITTWVRPPFSLMVDAGPDETANVGQSVTFAGSLTFPNGGISALDAEWDMDYDGSFSATITDTLTPVNSFTAPGDYRVALRITDPFSGVSIISTYMVKVRYLGPTVSIGISPATVMPLSVKRNTEDHSPPDRQRREPITMNEYTPIPELIEALYGDDGDSSFAAELLTATEVGLREVINATRHPDRQIRVATTYALRYVVRPEVIDALLTMLNDKNFQTDEDDNLRSEACIALGYMKKAAFRAIDTLISILANSPGRSAGCAAYALGEIGPAAARASPALIDLLRHPEDEDLPFHSSRLTYGVQALYKIGAKDPSLVPILVKLLTEKTPGFAYESNAILLLGMQGPNAASAEPLLRDYLENNEDFKLEVAVALARISAHDEMVQFLIDQLHSDREYKFGPAFALGMLGSIAAKALPHLRRLQSNPYDEATADDAIQTIQEALRRDRIAEDDTIDHEIPLHESIAKLESDDISQQDEAAAILAKSDAGIDALIEATRHTNHGVRLAAVFGLRGVVRDDVVDSLLAIMADQDNNDPFLRAQTCISLGSMGKAAEKAIDTLIPILASKPDRMTAAAAYALGEIGPSAARAIPELIEVLRRSKDLLDIPPDVAYAVVALRELEARHPELASMLVEVVECDSCPRPFRPSGLELIGMQESGTEEAEQMLRELAVRDQATLDNDEAAIRCAAAGALARISAPDEMVRMLIGQLELDEESQCQAVRQLAALGKIAVDALPYLRGLRSNPDVEAAVVDAIKTIQVSA